MDAEAIRAIIAERSRTDDEWQQAVEVCWDKLSSALTEDYSVTEKFLLEVCIADECSWVSEVYEEIFEKAPEPRYADLLRRAVRRFPEEDKKFHMSESLEKAISSYFD